MLCADAEIPSSRRELLERSAAAFEQAIERLHRFRSDNGGRIWYIVGGTVGIGWKYEAAKKTQYERLMVDARAGLCQARFKLGDWCLALRVCKAWREQRPREPEALYWGAGALAAVAHKKLSCPGEAGDFRAACDLYRQLDLDRLGSEAMRFHAAELGQALAKRGCQVPR
jgi:hypothetical protein